MCHNDSDTYPTTTTTTQNTTTKTQTNNSNNNKKHQQQKLGIYWNKTKPWNEAMPAVGGGRSKHTKSETMNAFHSNIYVKTKANVRN